MTRIILFLVFVSAHLISFYPCQGLNGESTFHSTPESPAKVHHFQKYRALPAFF